MKVGLDRLPDHDRLVARLRGARVGLLAHPASVARDLRHAVDVLGALGVKPALLFGPEHGYGGEAQDMVGVAGARDARTGAPIVSLYGDRFADLTPAPDHLDYALLRIAGAPGHQQVAGDVAGVTPSPRGWITLPTEAYPFTAQTPLLILQHPDGKELKLAIDTDAIIGVNSNGTRVRYRTNTEAGSSGAPCFDAHWNLVALHHAGDPNYAALHQPSYNQGIPLTAILTLLQERGKLALLNEAA